MESHQQIANKVSRWLMPLFASIACAAPFVIWILYDQRYHMAGILLSIMICRLMVRGYGQLQFQFLLARAHVNLATFSYAVALVVNVSLIATLTAQAGVVGLAMSSLLSTVALTVTQATLAGRSLQTKLSPVSATLAWTAAGILLAHVVANMNAI